MNEVVLFKWFEVDGGRLCHKCLKKADRPARLASMYMDAEEELKRGPFCPQCGRDLFFAYVSLLGMRRPPLNTVLYHRTRAGNMYTFQGWADCYMYRIDEWDRL